MTDAEKERERYVSAYSQTMVKIWREQITRLNVINTGALYRSQYALSMSSGDKFMAPRFAWQFNIYGIYVDYGVGSNTPRGNPGDIGRPNRRRRRRWFSRKFYASVMNIQEFFAENLGREYCNIITNALNPDTLRKKLTK